MGDIGGGGESGGGGSNGAWEGIEPLDWAKFIRIRNDVNDVQAYFQGIGGGNGGGGATGAASAGTAVTVSGGAPGTPEVVALDSFPVNVWEAQSLLIAQQSAYIEQVKRYFNERWQDISLIPKQLIGDLLTNVLEWAAARIGEAVEKVRGMMWGKLAEIGTTMLGKYLIYVTLFYTEGASLCDSIKKENTELLTLPLSRDNYQLRSQVLAQHEASVGNLLLHISTIEQNIANEMDVSLPIDDINIGSGGTPTTTTTTTEIPWEEVVAALHDIAMSEPVVKCPHTGECIYTKSLSRGR